MTDSKPQSIGEVLRRLYSHSMRHPADYTEWRKNLTVFAYAVGVERETIEDAHEEARREAEDPTKVDELVEALKLADQYTDELPFPQEGSS